MKQNVLIFGSALIDPLHNPIATPNEFRCGYALTSIAHWDEKC